MKLPKILFILHLPPPVHGSAMVGQYIKNNTKLNQTYNTRYVNLGTSMRINEIGKNAVRKTIRYLKIFIQVLKQVLLFNPQFCYFAITTKGIGFYKDAVIVLLVKLFGIKLVYHLHNKGISTMQGRFFDNLLYRFVFGNSDVILLSKYLYPDIERYVSKERVYFCPNGVPEMDQSSSFVETDNNLTKPNNTKINKQNDRNTTTEILFLSNLIESKGVLVLLEACKILHDKKLNYRCTFVGGDGDLNKESLRLILDKLCLNGTVNFAGPKFGAEKDKIFASADIFAFPTYYHNECFPLVLLEAMQHQLPVVSTFEGGIQSIVDNGSTGYLVPQNNIFALAQKLEQLINNPKLRTQMGDSGRIKYEKEFTIDTFNKKIETILNAVTSK